MNKQRPESYRRPVDWCDPRFLPRGLRTVPAVTEYLAIKRAITAVATEAGGESSVTELRRGFDKRANVEDIRTVQGADLDITKGWW